jgi:hypothetical protein
MKRMAMVGILAAAAISAAAQHHPPSTGATSGPAPLGEISFPTSGPAEAQKHFIEGVLLLHSFEYPRARRAFLEAQRLAPSFAMAYWGEAMTFDHPIWAEHDRPAALAALAKLGATPAERRAKAGTEREKLFLDAVEALYGEGPKEARSAAYSNAMGEIARRFPDDLEAKAFYALSILGLTGSVRNTENYMRAAAQAEEVYQKNPRHPGALHYLIHSYDDPVHAPLGLRAARVYGAVARGASHAQHMPSHIFFALGMWEDSIEANAASMKTARDEGVGGYHPLHWLQHAYHQLGRDDDAAKLVAIVEEDVKRSPSAYARSHLAMTRTTWLIEAAKPGPPGMMEPVDATGIAAYTAFAGHDLAIGLAHVRRGELAEARRVLASLRARNQQKKAAGPGENADRYSTAAQGDLDAAGIMEQMLEAAIAFGEGKKDEAIRRIAAVAAAEDALVFEYGPPAIPKPAWEAAGEMLLAAGRNADAADAFRKALKRYPNRRLSNIGLARAEGR